MKYFIPYLILLLGLSNCTSRPDAAYVEVLEQWRKQRKEQLKSEDGFLNLAGLYWLQPGENTFGSNEGVNLVFPPEFSENTGSLIWENDLVRLELFDAEVTQEDGTPAPDTIFTTDNNTVLAYESYRFYVIKRADQLGIRLKDLKHPYLAADIPITHFPISEDWKVEATFEPYEPPKEIMIENIIGLSYPELSPGILHFTLNGATYSLTPTSAGDMFFITFGDRTNGKSSYGGGRYLYTALPDENNKVLLDFNFAYNPPCAFTAFATCPLPPAENKLPIEILAGEKDFHWEK